MKTLTCLLLALILFTGCDEPQAPKKQPKAQVRVVLDFHAEWCGPCKANDPTVRQMEAAGVRVRRIDIDRQSDLAAQYGITSVPTYVILENGKEVRRTQDIGQLKSLKTWLLGRKKPTPAPRQPLSPRQPNPDLEQSINSPLQQNGMKWPRL